MKNLNENATLEDAGRATGAHLIEGAVDLAENVEHRNAGLTICRKAALHMLAIMFVNDREDEGANFQGWARTLRRDLEEEIKHVDAGEFRYVGMKN